MNDKIRAISFSFDHKSITRRQVGKTMAVQTPRGSMNITISSIEKKDNTFAIPSYLVYGKNDSGEYGLWKEESALDMSVEYDLQDLLTP